MYACVMSEYSDDAESNIILHDCINYYTHLQQQEVPSSADSQYENVPAPPQSVLSMKGCAA